jgi:hypothetical protein
MRSQTPSYSCLVTDNNKVTVQIRKLSNTPSCSYYKWLFFLFQLYPCCVLPSFMYDFEGSLTIGSPPLPKHSTKWWIPGHPPPHIPNHLTEVQLLYFPSPLSLRLPMIPHVVCSPCCGKHQCQLWPLMSSWWPFGWGTLTTEGTQAIKGWLEIVSAWHHLFPSVFLLALFS